MLLLKLFWVFFKIGLFAIGGAYSFLPLIEKEVVENSAWISRVEFLDVMGFARLFPGAISVKFATYVGYKIAGIPGAVMANLGCIMPAVIFMVTAGHFYMKYRNLPQLKGLFSMVEIAVLAMIAAVILRMVDWRLLFNIKGAVVALAAFLLFYLFKIHPAFIIIGAGVIGWIGKNG